MFKRCVYRHRGIAVLWQPTEEAGALHQPMTNSILFATVPLAALLLPAPSHRPAAVLPNAVEEVLIGQPAGQMRIERRVIIRVSPGSADRGQEVAQRQMMQQPAGDCVPAAAIAGVEPTSNNRLLLFMRDRHVLAADLADGCSAAHYYAGFYMENNGDGQLCVGRDHLRARDGSDCQVTSFQRLVPASQ